jgi:hypothetical protein
VGEGLEDLEGPVAGRAEGFGQFAPFRCFEAGLAQLVDELVAGPDVHAAPFEGGAGLVADVAEADQDRMAKGRKGVGDLGGGRGGQHLAGLADPHRDRVAFPVEPEDVPRGDRVSLVASQPEEGFD